MSRIAKLALIPPFLIGILLTFQALFVPAKLSETLGGIAGTGPVGNATIFADFAALFVTFTICVAGALFAGKRGWLFAPICLFGFTAIGRIYFGLMNGFAPGALQPIAIEIVACALMIFALRSKPA
ncbi:hypothetical protein GCM10009069_16310 [Algimonas arctica]|jgi:hypothetical protein|uniref:DUF4345 domain-containing protein n=1 Tax=Algimonas arctica TaxID=1479486 RepID=A0A8J3G2D9_9PROT|nr:hypothetical protein [Algimonas arctica]GHA93939.1 hypothetical protein GCM10009069_16310 [Algimonas arctica]